MKIYNAFYSSSMKMNVPHLCSSSSLPPTTIYGDGGQCIYISPFRRLRRSISLLFLIYFYEIVGVVDAHSSCEKYTISRRYPTGDSESERLRLEREVQFLPLIKAPSPSPSPSQSLFPFFPLSHSLSSSLDKIALVFVANGKPLCRNSRSRSERMLNC